MGVPWWHYLVLILIAGGIPLLFGIWPHMFRFYIVHILALVGGLGVYGVSGGDAPPGDYSPIALFGSTAGAAVALSLLFRPSAHPERSRRGSSSEGAPRSEVEQLRVEIRELAEAIYDHLQAVVESRRDGVTEEDRQLILGDIRFGELLPRSAIDTCSRESSVLDALQLAFWKDHQAADAATTLEALREIRDRLQRSLIWCTDLRNRFEI